MIQIADGTWEEGQRVWVYNDYGLGGLPLIASFVPTGISEIANGVCLDAGHHTSFLSHLCYSNRDAVVEIARQAMRNRIERTRSQADELNNQVKELEHQLANLN